MHDEAASDLVDLWAADVDEGGDVDSDDDDDVDDLNSWRVAGSHEEAIDPDELDVAIRRRIARDTVKPELIKGFFWLIGGLIVSLLLYWSAVEEAKATGEGTYFVFWGAIAYGAWRFLRAAYFYVHPTALLKRSGN